MTTGTADSRRESQTCPSATGRPAGRKAREAMLPLLLALACSTAACGGDDPPALTGAQQAAPAIGPIDTITAPTSALRLAVSDFLAAAGATPSTEYSIARIDLDGDGREDGLVLLTGTDWCGSGGCTLLVFRADDRRFHLVSETSMVNGPVVVSRQLSNGWRDILVPDPQEDRTIALRFNGAAYPADPAGPGVESADGDTVFEGEIGLF